MSEVFLPYKDLLINYTQISGACVRYSASRDEPEVCFNPKLYSSPIYSQEILKNPDDISANTFTDFDFIDYAEQLKRAGNIIHKSCPDIVLVPMRGGVRPWEHLRIYCNIGIEKSVLFPFTAEEKFSDETASIIDNALSIHSAKDRLNIVCIDAAEGGQGSAQLVHILEKLHSRTRKSLWTVTLCLFVPKDRAHAEWRNARERTNEPNFSITVTLLPVAKVIGEDMKSGMISLENFGEVRQFKTQVHGIDYLIESAELPAVIDQKILEATHLSLETEPFSTVIDIRQWKPGTVLL